MGFKMNRLVGPEDYSSSHDHYFVLDLIGHTITKHTVGV
jgi:hypothetical protein